MVDKLGVLKVAYLAGRLEIRMADEMVASMVDLMVEE